MNGWATPVIRSSRRCFPWCAKETLIYFLIVDPGKAETPQNQNTGFPLSRPCKNSERWCERRMRMEFPHGLFRGNDELIKVSLKPNYFIIALLFLPFRFGMRDTCSCRSLRRVSRANAAL